MSLVHQIPGYAAALAAEARVRAAPFVDLPPRVLCGVEVRPLTLRDYERLSYVRSPFVCGGEADRGDVALLLWNQQASAHGDEATFAARLDALDLPAMCAEVGGFVDEALMDAPKGASGSAATVGMAAAMVHRMRIVYPRITRDEVLDMDLRELFGCFRCIARDADPKGITFNPLSDPVKSRWAREQTEQAARP